jgi:hypothetical protein
MWEFLQIWERGIRWHCAQVSIWFAFASRPRPEWLLITEWQFTQVTRRWSWELPSQ